MDTTDRIYTAVAETPLGPLVLGATAAGLCLAEFADGPRHAEQLGALRRLLGCPDEPGETPHLVRAREELAGYFAGALRDFTVPLVYPGTAFQRAMWGQLCQVPYGETRSYGELAQALGRPTASRAVGAANGRNRIAILIPCHRLVGAGGRLTGYGGGLWRKRALLDLERA